MTERAARCETCIYLGAGSRCRAMPPSIAHDSRADLAAWPVVHRTDWCGHYRPNAEATRALVEAGT